MPLPRILTALIGIPLFLFLVHAGGTSFSLIMVGISTLCCYEYALMLRIKGRPVWLGATIIFGALLAAHPAFGISLTPMLALGVLFLMLAEFASPVRSLDRAALTLFGAIFAGWMPAHLAMIRDLRPHGEALTFMLLASIWTMDTVAYAVGKKIGRRSLAKNISPHKTWEGAIAGFFGAMTTTLVFHKYLLASALSSGEALVLGAGIGIIGQFSDLAESLIKRDIGFKDSGAILPGHGGILDRFDSLVLCAPAFYYALILR